MSDSPTTTRAAPYRITIGTTWASPRSTRLVTEMWPARFGQEAALQYREGGLHKTISLQNFRGWISNSRAKVVKP